MASVSCEDDDGSKVALKGSVKVGKALNIKHVDLINEEDSWYKLCNTVINILVHYFVDLKSKLLCDFSLLGSVDLAHQR